MRRKRWWIAAVVLLAGLVWLRPEDRGGPYPPAFAALNEALKTAGSGRPTLVLDLAALDHNLDALMAHVGPDRTYRVVAKSLPSVPLLRHVMDRADTRALMAFHEPFVRELLRAFPDADILVGKPLPVQAAATFFAAVTDGGATPLSAVTVPARQVQWLIDGPQRLAQYQQLARSLGQRLRINVEIDVGLHRGGVPDPGALRPLLDAIAADPAHLEFAGLMGYDAHVAAAPPVLSSTAAAFADMLARYQAFVAAIEAAYPAWLTGPVALNGAGSKTIALYDDVALLNDLAAGSGLVKPSDFDAPTLAAHRPALFIATPILKRMDGVRIPYIEWASPLLGAWDPNQQQTFFIYGGLWLATPAAPPGLQQNALYGRSSNQDMLNGSRRIEAGVDDYVFMRPTQSEAVMLQFGDLLVVRDGAVVDRWPVFQEGR